MKIVLIDKELCVADVTCFIPEARVCTTYRVGGEPENVVRSGSKQHIATVRRGGPERYLTSHADQWAAMNMKYYAVGYTAELRPEFHRSVGLVLSKEADRALGTEIATQLGAIAWITIGLSATDSGFQRSEVDFVVSVGVSPTGWTSRIGTVEVLS